MNEGGIEDVWEAVAVYRDGTWYQRFKEAPDFTQTLEFIEAGDDVWIFVTDSAVLTPPPAQPASRIIYAVTPQKNVVAYDTAGPGAGWEDLGGLASFGATGALVGDVEYVFINGEGDDLLYRTLEGGEWSDWQNLGGSLSSSPAPLVTSDGRLYVAVRWADGGLAYRVLEDGSWSQWIAPGGGIIGVPAAVETPQGEAMFLIKGLDRALYYLTADGVETGTWQLVGGLLTSSPSAVQAHGGVEVFFRGDDYFLWSRRLDDGEWGSEIRHDKLLKDGPTATLTPAGDWEVWYRTMDGLLGARSCGAAFSVRGAASDCVEETVEFLATSQPVIQAGDVVARGRDGNVTAFNSDLPTQVAGAIGAGPTTDAQAFSPGVWKDPQYPDMITLRPSELRVDFEGGVKVLSFSNQIANGGSGNIQVRGLTDTAIDRTNALQEIRNSDGTIAFREDAGIFAFHPQHNHFHIDDYTDYEIRETLEGQAVASQLKVSYCLIDYDQYTAPPSSDQYYDSCGQDIQGIQAGWLDNYFWFLQGQDINIEGLPNGDYYLVSIGDPRLKFAELDDASGNCNNTAWVRFTLNGDQIVEHEGGDFCGGQAAPIEVGAEPGALAEKIEASLGMKSTSLAWYCDVLPGLDATKSVLGLHTVVAAAALAIENSD
jgi:hypothetical protein